MTSSLRATSGVKEVKRPKPVPRNTKYIRGLSVWGEQAHHCEALIKTTEREGRCNGDRLKVWSLTEGGLHSFSEAGEKSAEVVVLEKRSGECAYHTPESPKNKEGPNG